jgi:hypothetical protein
MPENMNCCYWGDCHFNYQLFATFPQYNKLRQVTPDAGTKV